MSVEACVRGLQATDPKWRIDLDYPTTPRNGFTGLTFGALPLVLFTHCCSELESGFAQTIDARLLHPLPFGLAGPHQLLLLHFFSLTACPKWD